MTNPISLRPLKSFGDVAAEDDAVLEYFLQTDAVKRIEDQDIFLVLGRKGSGKTAIVRHFTEGTTDVRSKSLNLRRYPWNVHSARIDRGASDMEAYVSSWRYLITLQIATMVSADTDRPMHDMVVQIRSFLNDNYGGTDPDLENILRPRNLKLSKFSFQPSVMGNQLGGISLERSSGDMNFGIELNALSDAILNNCRAIIKNESLGPYLLHFDELDQGLSRLDETKRKLLIGLILAARDIRIDSQRDGTAVSPVVYLRTDLWDELEFSDKNKINQTHTLTIEWTSTVLRQLVEARLDAKLEKGAIWDQIIDDGLMRGSQSKWSHIVARSFLRPRDIIHFLNVSLANAKIRDGEPLVFINKDIVDSRDSYSRYLKQELDDEILPHWPKWEQALKACSAISRVTFSREEFIREYEDRRASDNSADADHALELLYKFSVIGYSSRSGYGGSSWIFHYVDPQAGWDSGAKKFKVHLGLKEYAKLRETRG